MSSRVRISNDGDTTRIEIPALDHRILAVLWLFLALVGASVFVTQFHKVTLPLLPLLLICVLASLIFIFKGITGWQWSSRGMETFDASPQQLLYQCEGAFLDRKRICIPTEELNDIRVLQFGIGDNRLEMSSRRGKIYCGKNLSRDDASHVRELLLRWHGKPT
jgi:hypothetical protein